MHRTTTRFLSLVVAFGSAGTLAMAPLRPAMAQGTPMLSPPPLVPSPPPSSSSTSSAPASSPAPSAAWRADYDQGQSLMGQKRFNEAVEKLRPVTAAVPDFAPGWYALALAARRSANCADAIPAYRRYATLRPAEAEPYFGLGLCLRDSGDRPGAATALKRFLELERRPDQQKWIDSARSLIAALETPAPAPEAMSMSTSTSTSPSTAGRGAAAYQEAQRLRDQGKIDAALAKFAEVATLEPDLMAARAAWGELLVKVRRDADAIGVFRAAIERNPQYPLIWYELAFALRETGRFAEAVQAYRRYIPLRPNDPDPHYGLARALAKLGKDEEALRSYETYVAMESRPSEVRWVASAKTEIAALQRTRPPRPPPAPPPADLRPATSAPSRPSQAR